MSQQTRKPKTIFLYRMKSVGGRNTCGNKGFAPCEMNGVLTLNTCKGGQIRKGKLTRWGLRNEIGKGYIDNPNDVIIVGIYHNHLCWYAQLTSIVKMAYYHSPEGKRRWGKNRPDQIFDTKKPDDDQVENFQRNKNNNVKGSHDSESCDLTDELLRDIAGTYTLISEGKYYYEGNKMSEIPEELLNTETSQLKI
jgi:hypothetical protein